MSVTKQKFISTVNVVSVNTFAYFTRDIFASILYSPASVGLFVTNFKVLVVGLKERKF